MNIINGKTGWIEVICGSMFSGKTEELIRRIRRTEYAKQKIQIFKPIIDNRYEENHIVSHNQLKELSQLIDKSREILDLLEPDTEVVAIDEVQFLDMEIIEICNQLADSGIRVIVAGLDMDFRGVPFGPMPQLLAIAEYIDKPKAICMVCGNPASRTQRLTHNSTRVVVGAGGVYEARCRHCHEIFDDQIAKEVK